MATSVLGPFSVAASRRDEGSFSSSSSRLSLGQSAGHDKLAAASRLDPCSSIKCDKSESQDATDCSDSLTVRLMHSGKLAWCASERPWANTGRRQRQQRQQRRPRRLGRFTFALSLQPQARQVLFGQAKTSCRQRGKKEEACRWMRMDLAGAAGVATAAAAHVNGLRMQTTR